MNRSYNRPSRPIWGQSFTSTMVNRIVLANVAVFFLQNIFPGVTSVFALNPRMVVENLNVWQLGSYMFLHGNFMHLFFNMLMLWIFGSAIESAWGGRQFLRYYLICGLGGAVASLVFNFDARVVGASGAIFGLYLAYAMMFPNNYIYLYFVFPVKAKYMVAGIAILQILNGISGPAGIAYFAHLGGMAAGLFFFRDSILRRLRASSGPRRAWPTAKPTERPREPERNNDDIDNIDSILDKISSKGYENLTTTEKRILENYSRKRSEEPD